MEEKEAIKYIKNHGFISDDVKDMSISALEKQIPKEPEEQRYFRTFNQYAGLCPSCRGGANSEFQYCGDCGQKLDWESGGEER